jgi:hypothetical protein
MASSCESGDEYSIWTTYLEFLTDDLKSLFSQEVNLGVLSQYVLRITSRNSNYIAVDFS